MFLFTKIQQIFFCFVQSLWKTSCFKSIYVSCSLNLEQKKGNLCVLKNNLLEISHNFIFKGNPIENLISVIYQNVI